jgi:hypothetical protein
VKAKLYFGTKTSKIVDQQMEKKETLVNTSIIYQAIQTSCASNQLFSGYSLTMQRIHQKVTSKRKK